MKRYLLIAITLLGAWAATRAQGWPANYGGVMLQGFYWNSFADSRWSKLTSEAEELSKYFDILWVPNSAQPADGPTAENMGYTPALWFNHNSIFGTEEQLRTMIATYKQKGTIVMNDCVLNHKDGSNSWVYFPDESRDGYTITWDNTNYSGICRNDECNSNGYSTTGAYDTGENFAGARDLDHTNSRVQENCKTYVRFLVDYLGYGGLRYDQAKGFDPKYNKMYTEACKVKYSVGEYFDGQYGLVTGWINGTGKTSAAFDFPLKFKINDAFNNNNWSVLSDKGVAGDPNMSQWAVTFIDNHDTYEDHNKMGNTANMLAANAFILAMPGTPCIFLKHWQAYKEEIGKMILARKAAGVTNTSTITYQGEWGGGYRLEVEGSNGTIRCLSGYVTDLDDTGWTPVSIGNSTNQNYAFYVSNNVVVDYNSSTEAPAEATYEAGKLFAYFEAPASWKTDVKAWVWNADNDNENFTGGTWPGQALTKVTTLPNGNTLYKWVYSGSSTNQPTGVIFSCNSGNTKTSDLDFANGGYYTIYKRIDTVTGTDIDDETDEIPAIATYVAGKTFAYFEAPSTWSSDICAWAWGNEGDYCGTWPGVAMEKVGTLPSGRTVWRWVYNGDFSSLPNGILFNSSNGATQTTDFDFVNGGYYTTSKLVGAVSADNVLPDDIQGLEPPATKFTVYVKSNTAKPYIYAWNDNGTLSKKWPGTQLTSTKHLHGQDWYYFDFEEGPVNVIFNMGSDATKTEDIKGITKNIFYEYSSTSKKATDVTNTITTDDGGSTTLSGYAKYVRGKLFAYFEAPTSWDEDVTAFAWGTAGAYSDEWPGTALVKAGTAKSGNKLWLWTYDGSLEGQPDGIVFASSAGSIQTGDLAFVNGAYYNAANIVALLPEPATVMGDLNGDDAVDGNDVSILLEMVLAGGITDAQIAVADINGDNAVDGNDVSALLEMVLAGN